MKEKNIKSQLSEETLIKQNEETFLQLEKLKEDYEQKKILFEEY